MLMIVRLYPKTDLSRVWNYIENEIKDDPSKPFTPLYASQSEGMMNVGVIIDVDNPDNIASFITEDIVTLYHWTVDSSVLENRHTISEWGK